MSIPANADAIVSHCSHFSLSTGLLNYLQQQFACHRSRKLNAVRLHEFKGFVEIGRATDHLLKREI
jgi:hypothetical protein